VFVCFLCVFVCETRREAGSVCLWEVIFFYEYIQYMHVCNVSVMCSESMLVNGFLNAVYTCLHLGVTVLYVRLLSPLE